MLSGKSTILCRCGCRLPVEVDVIGSASSIHVFRPGHFSARRSHGRSYSPEFKIWAAMKSRCANPRNRKYPRYGGRGIRVCEQWANSFSTFAKDMGPRPSMEHSIDRVNNDGHYEPSNCRWTTSREQAANSTHPTERLMTAFGRTQNIRQWALERGFSPEAVHQRLKRGWSFERSITEPLATPQQGGRRSRASVRERRQSASLAPIEARNR